MLDLAFGSLWRVGCVVGGWESMGVLDQVLDRRWEVCGGLVAWLHLRSSGSRHTTSRHPYLWSAFICGAYSPPLPIRGRFSSVGSDDVGLYSSAAKPGIRSHAVEAPQMVGQEQAP